MTKAGRLIKAYAIWDDKVKNKRFDLDRMRERKTSIKIIYSKTPGGEPESLEDYAVKIDEAERELAYYKQKRFLAFSELMAAMQKLKTYKQFDILYRRGILRESWTKICLDLDMSRSGATALYDRAIKALDDLGG